MSTNTYLVRIPNNKKNLTIQQYFGIAKNRYEILFFNKFELVLTLLLLKNYNLLNISNEASKYNENPNSNSLNSIISKNAEKITKFENDIINRIVDEPEKYDEELIKKIKNMYKKNPLDYINKTNLKFLYQVLRNTCYLKTYFRYSDNSTLKNRFNGIKKTNFIFVYNKIQNYFKRNMIKDAFNKKKL